MEETPKTDDMEDTPNIDEGLLNEMKKRGVFVTSMQELYNWGRKNSLWPLQFGLACCAIEMIAAAQAFELRAINDPGQRVAALVAKVRALSAFIDRDRPLGEDIERVAAAIAAAELP